MIEPPWLLNVLNGLRAMYSRLPHALLVHGPPGWGEMRVVNALALDLIGIKADRDARGVAHPDLRWCQPEDGLIKVDAVRNLVEYMAHTPQSAGRKIAVIEDADRMNVNAANALLKSLEEPPPESFIVLSTSAPERLLATVRSRCQAVPVRRGSDAEVRSWLRATGVDPETAGHWAVEYGGAPLPIVAAAEQGQAPLWALLQKAARSPTAARTAAEGLRAEDLVDLLERWLRITHWLLREQGAPERSVLVDFAADVLDLRRAALVNSGLNRTIQLQRLLLLWSEIWQGAAIPELPQGIPQPSTVNSRAAQGLARTRRCPGSPPGSRQGSAAPGRRARPTARRRRPACRRLHPAG